MLPQAFNSSAVIQEQALSDARPFRSSVQAEPESDEAAIVELDAVDISLARSKIRRTDVENPLLTGRIPAKRDIRTSGADRFVHIVAVPLIICTNVKLATTPGVPTGTPLQEAK